MNQKHSRVQLLLMFLISAVTQVIVMVRSSAVAAAFGVGTDIDAYNAVHSIANFLFSFISSGITTVLIPAYLQKKEQKSIDSFLSLLYLVGIFAVAFSMLLRKPILTLYGSGQAGFVEIGSSIFLITMLSQFFNTQLGVASAYFQVKDQYNTPKVCTLIANTVQLLLVVLDKDITVYRYAMYVGLTTVGNALVQMVIAAIQGYRYRITLQWHDSEFKRMLRVFLPTMFSAGLYQITLLTDSLLSSRLGSGQISILAYSNQVVTLVNSLLVTNILTFVYPKIVDSLRYDMKRQQEKLVEYILFGEALMLLLVAGFITIGEEAVSILYEHGKFSSENTSTVYYCFCLYMIGFPLNITRDLIYRFFYSHGDTDATFINSVIISVLNFVISILLSNFIGIYGIILGTVLSAACSVVMIFTRMRKKYGFHASGKKLAIEQGKLLLCTVLSIGLVMVLKSQFSLGVIGTILLFGICTVVIFAILLIVTRSTVLKTKF